MAVQFGVSDLFRKNVVALELTKTRHTEMDNFRTGARADFYNHGKNYVAALNPDKRAIAGAHDPYFMMHEVCADVHPEWEAHIWTSAAMRMFLIDMANPTDILFTGPEGCRHTMELCGDSSTNVTFLNSMDFAILEDWWPTSPEMSALNPKYSVCDMEDIEDGSLAGTFDYVEAHFAHVMGVDSKISDAYLNLLKPGGTMVVLCTGAYKGLYREHTMIHHNYYEPNMALLNRSDLDVTHYPIDPGYTVIQRPAS